MARSSRRHPLLLAALVGLALLVALPGIEGTAPTAASVPVAASSAPPPPVPAASAPGTNPLAGTGPVAGAPASAPSPSARPAAPAGRFAAVAPVPSAGAVRPTATKSSYDWSSAYIGYGAPWPPADLMLGVGEGVAVDNARAEFVFFGGLASGGLSNWTWTYEYHFNASNPANSTESGNTSSSPTSPSARTNMSFGTYQAGGEALLFGGLTSLAGQTTDNATWLYDFANDTWKNVTGPGAPPPREDAAFAVDQTDGIGLLFGGIAPKYSAHGVSGTVIWKDTWAFDFRTHNWTEISSPVAPGGRFGASMVWDAADNTFLLFGGCSLSCSSQTWAFSMSTQSWQEVSALGTIPPARAGASFAWDPGAGQAVLTGGYSYTANGTPLVYSDSYVLLPTGIWSRISPSAPGPPPIFQPGPVYGASTTWANFPGCNAMTVFGGSISLASPPEFVYVVQPNNDSPTYQCWGFLSQPRAPHPPPPCSRQSLLVVTVESSATEAPIPNALVEISGQCLPAIGRTGGTGSVTFATNTPDNISINVSAVNFHGDQLYYNYTYNDTPANTSGVLTRYVTVFLEPYPALNVQVLGNTGGTFYVPVAGASVEIDNFSVVAITGANGWGNNSSVQQFNQSVVVTATANAFSTAWKGVFIPYTGEVNVTLVLLHEGELLVTVVDARTEIPIANATGTITRLDPGLPAPFAYRTTTNGTYAIDLPLGNYSATAQATGYQANRTGRAAFVDWVALTRLTVRLQPSEGTNLSVRLVDADTGAPIRNGTVTFGNGPPIPTTPSGWANASDLLPPGPMRVLGQAPGYLSNSTVIQVAYLTTLPPLTMRLAPICPGGCGGGGNGSGLGGSPFFPAGGPALLFLLAAPAILAVAGAIYAIGVSARRGRSVRAASPAPGGRTVDGA